MGHFKWGIRLRPTTKGLTMSIKRAVLALGIVGLFLVPATAANAAPSDQDATYLRAAHQSNLAEIAGGKLAEQKANSQQVKDLGERFVTDHTKLDQSLTQTASALGVSLPSAPNSKQQELAARYRAASGSQFDSLFVSTQMQAHMMAMRLGQTELAQGSDAQAKKVAQTAAPVIASHHSALQSTARSLGIPDAIGTGTGGEAAHRMITTPVLTLLAAGLALLIAAVVLLRRRQLVRG
jgi:putative membrane protein